MIIATFVALYKGRGYSYGSVWLKCQAIHTGPSIRTGPFRQQGVSLFDEQT